MNKKEAQIWAKSLREKWEQIVTDALRHGYLSTRICLGCGRHDCGGCPAGTTVGWHPDLKKNK